MNSPSPLSLATHLIQKGEGLRLSPYKDSLGKLTIGWGFLMSRPDARSRMAQVGVTSWTPPIRLTAAQAGALLDLDVADAIADLKHLIPNWATLSPNRQAALASMRYQLGGQGLRGFHKFLNAISAGQFDIAGAEMLNSTWAQQTPSRAKEDHDLIVLG